MWGRIVDGKLEVFTEPRDVVVTRTVVRKEERLVPVTITEHSRNGPVEVETIGSEFHDVTVKEEVTVPADIFGDPVALAQAGIKPLDEIKGFDAERQALIVADLVAFAKARRKAVQASGITVDGLRIATDDASRSAIALAKLDAASIPGWSTEWKTMDGTFATVDGAAMDRIAAAVSAHVSKCFADEKAALAAIHSGKIKNRADVERIIRGTT